VAPPSPRSQADTAAIRVVVADDDLSILETLTDALSADPDFEVVGAARTPDEALRAARTKQPDVAVIEAKMPDGGGVQAIQGIAERCPETRVVALSSSADEQTALSVLRVGATSYLVKGSGLDELRDAIRNTAAGLAIISPEVASSLATDFGRDGEGEPEHQIASEETRIGRVISNGGFTMAFQPIVDLGGGVTVGFEALARFPVEPVRGTEAWFAEAESTGEIADLEVACIEATLDRLPLIPPQCYLSLNVSPGTVASDRLPDVLADAPGDQVVLEVTEHSAVEDYDALNSALGGLRDDGLRLAIDDVGAGFSSLRHLLRLRPDFIKLDRSLCRHVDSGPGRVLLEGLVSFSSEIGATVIAEGVESRQELVALRDTGIGYGQGFLLGAPQAMPRSGRWRSQRRAVKRPRMARTSP
jgi:EAL domain-containing protein (putative c-di-GMP-specific phosphodiesterase class I)/ActR/RegA family two-component response regulator